VRHPERVANYRIVHRVGRGATGRTYIAVRDAAGHDVAYVVCLKTPPPRFADDPAYVRDFENEARIASLLQHPHIVPLQDHGLDAERNIRFLAFRYVEGPDLSEVIEGHAKLGRRMPWPAVATLAVQMAHALHHAHADLRDSERLKPRPPIIHRDICPPNILIAPSGVSYLTDFGLARPVERGRLMPSLVGSGRLPYMAPERLVDGSRYDARADLFSLGVVLFEALTNELPYDASSSATYIRQALAGDRRRIRDLRAEWDPTMEPFAAVVDRLLEPEPARRFLSAGEVIDALGRLHIPAVGFRQLAESAEAHMPPWRRNVRLRSTGEMAQPAASRSFWGQTDPQQIPELLAAEPTAPDRDFVRVGPDDAERLLARRHVPLSNTLPGYVADPASLNFGATDPDRPTLDVDATRTEPETGEQVLIPPADLDATGQPRPPEEPGGHSALETASVSATAAQQTQSPPHARVATSLPAYEVSGDGLRPVKSSGPHRPHRAPRRRWILWAVGATLLALVTLPCAVAGAAALFGTMIAGAASPQFGGTPDRWSSAGSSDVFAWIGTYTPALVDVNDDGYRDAIGFSWDFDNDDAVTAVSGADGTVLWVHGAEEDWSTHFDEVFVTVPTAALVVVVDRRGRATGIDAHDGTDRWTAALGARGLRACLLDDGQLALTTTGHTTYRIALVDGSLTRIRAPDGCQAIPIVGENRSRLSHSMPGYDRERPEGGLPWPREQVRGAWRSPEGDHYVVEVRLPDDYDRPVPHVAVLSGEGALRWVTPAAADPDAAQSWGIRHLTAQGETLFAVYDMTGRGDAPRRVAALDLQTGRRLWDAPLEGAGHFDSLLADERRVFVSHWALEVLDRQNGRHIGRIGVFPNERR